LASHAQPPPSQNLLFGFGDEIVLSVLALAILAATVCVGYNIVSPFLPEIMQRRRRRIGNEGIPGQYQRE
jgi:hypothetical protein